MDDSPSRLARREQHRKRNRIIAIVGGIVVVVAAVIAVVVIAGGGGNSKSASTTSTTADHQNSVNLPLGPVTADSAGATVTVTPDQAQQILGVLGKYVQGATVEPLRSGKPITADLSAVFDPGTLARATTIDRGVVLDEGLPKVTGKLTVDAQPITMVGLGDQTGKLTLVSAAVLLDVNGQTQEKGGPLKLVRKADFVFAPNEFGVWQVTAYSMVVTRAGAGLDAPTTSSTSTTGAKK